MQERVRRGDALNVLEEGTRVSDSVYALRKFVEGKDYCDPVNERWIWSIGERFSDGKIFAATDIRFHNDPNFSCLFLR
jgi:hypothetical protein